MGGSNQISLIHFTLIIFSDGNQDSVIIARGGYYSFREAGENLGDVGRKGNNFFDLGFEFFTSAPVIPGLFYSAAPNMDRSILEFIEVIL
ncbi:MAG: hypothetical protein A2V86_03300 [Deltaproteobacteria bacterium RBG_16_49_23]|nr:MAG: hypothetical protein A2V86_03300 [Deltaproteobacteria bacterium RBG_16_49_23]